MTAPRFLLLAAMAEEAAPFLDTITESERPGPSPHSTLTGVEIAGVPGQVLRSGIGPVAAAAALAAWLAVNPPTRVLSVGSAGGLHERVAVGDVIIGEAYRYADADATAFGYEFGQVPGQPAVYPGAPVDAETTARTHLHSGLIVTAGSFISAELAAPIRSHFPGALAVDMESAALAQTCHLFGGVPFTSIRGISDLCTPRAGVDFHDGLGLAAARSSEATRALIAQL